MMRSGGIKAECRWCRVFPRKESRHALTPTRPYRPPRLCAMSRLTACPHADIQRAFSGRQAARAGPGVLSQSALSSSLNTLLPPPSSFVPRPSSLVSSFSVVPCPSCLLPPFSLVSLSSVLISPSSLSFLANSASSNPFPPPLICGARSAGPCSAGACQAGRRLGPGR
jgi:hypothetical protein